MSGGVGAHVCYVIVGCIAAEIIKELDLALNPALNPLPR